MLRRMRGLRCWIFLRPDEGARRIYLGHASPHEVRWTLAQRFPTLESAYARSCADVAPYEIKSPQGALDPSTAAQVVGAFLSEVQRADLPPADEKGEWIQLPKRHEQEMDKWEQAQWIGAKDVSSVLGDALRSSSVSGDVGTLGDEQREALLRSEGDFVALLGDEWTFNGLIDRRKTLEELGTAETA